MLPGTDLYELRKKLRLLVDDLAGLGRELMTPTEDVSIHPEVRALLIGQADSLVVVLASMVKIAFAKGVERSFISK